MANDRIVRIIVAGDATSGQKALKSIGDSATTAEVKVSGFAKSFLKLGAAFGVGANIGDTAINLFKDGAQAVADYNLSLDQSTKLLLGQTKSQEATAAALAVARTEADKGRGTYQELAAAMAGLNTVAQISGRSLAEVTQVAEILAAVNPEEGIKGATFALREAATGDFTSVIERFNLSRTTINKLKSEGVPAIDAVRKAMEELGYDTQFLDTANQSAAKQVELLKGALVELAASKTQDFFTILAGAAKDLTTELTDQESATRTVIERFNELKNSLGGVGESAFGEAARGVDVGAAKLERSLLEAFKNIPNNRAADDPMTKWLDQQIANYTKAIDEGKPYVEIKSRELAEAAAGGGKPPPAATAKAELYGREIVAGIVRGMDSGQVDALEKIGGMFDDLFKTDPSKATQATVALAQALKQTADGGQLSDDAMADLSAAYGLQTPLVVQLIGAHNTLTNAQNRQKDAAQGLTDAQGALQQVQNRAKGDLAGYEAAITSAQQAAATHAQETADALEPLQDALDGVRKAAEESGRASAGVIAGLQGELEGLQNQASANAAVFERQIAGMQGELAGLQGQAEANAAAFQAQVATAQAAYEQAQTRRQQLQGVLQAALNGELETYLRVNDIKDETIRKIGEQYQAEIDGQRRAKEGANDKVTGLNRAANKEDLDYLQKIQAARSGGNEQEARRLERELAARQKQRQAGMTLAQAEARVANDNYDEKAAQLAKEGKAQDEIAGNAAKAAGAEVARIQTAAQAQKVADDAAIAAKQGQIKAVQDQATAQKSADDAAVAGKSAQIKAVTDAQKAEQDRYAAQQRGIQAEIDAVGRAAKTQAQKDAADLVAAQAAYTQRQTYWNLENTGAQTAVNIFGAFATNTTTIANDSKAAYEQLEKITKLDFQNVIDAANAAKTLANQPPAPPAPPPALPGNSGNGAQGGGRDDRAGTSTASGSPGLPTLFSGDDYLVAPAGYHAEYDTDDNLWYVADGFGLANYGKTPGVIPPPRRSQNGDGGDSTRLSAAGVGSPRLLRSAGIGGGGAGLRAAGDPQGGIVINNHFPNVRSIEDASAIDKLVSAQRRALNDVLRGGLDPGKVDA